MGCDIHGLCEVKENGVWKVNTKKVFKNSYYLSDEELAERRKDRPDYERSDWQEIEFEEHPTDARSYDWFAILADVRNGRGFAGVRTGEGFDVIAEPRGVPKDATKKWKKEVKNWGCDMHSQSYLSVEDFDNFDWSQKTSKWGTIQLNQYKELRGTGKSPEDWSGSVFGGKTITISMDEANDILDGKTVTIEEDNYFGKLRGEEPKIHLVNLESDYQIYVSYEWEILYSEWFDYKIKAVVEPLRKLKEEYEDVRYVFGFDN